MRYPTLTHPMIGVVPPPISIAEPAAPPEGLLPRIQAAFRGADVGATKSGPSMWDVVPRREADFIAALSSARPDELSAHFENMFQRTLLEGMAHTGIFLDSERNPYRADYFALRVVDALLSLAEALAVLPQPSNQQTRLPEYIAYLNSDLHELLPRVEKALGFSLAAPAIGRPNVCVLGGVPTTPDLLRHAYVVHRLHEIGLEPDDAILEIGGGFGAVALLAHRAGFRSYTVIDLPHVNAIQTCYLGAALGEDAVAGYREAKAAIQLLPPQAIAELPDRSFALVLNMDSLPELSSLDAETYLRHVRRLAPLLLSINQEAQKFHAGIGRQLWVPELLQQIGGFHRLHRQRYWMEQGYSEELYQVSPEA